MFDAGVESPLGEVLAAVRSVVAGFEVDGLAAQEAAQVVEECGGCGDRHDGDGGAAG